ncbi:hypothetical protein [Streptomyces sp. NBC_01012]|uniref:hypothetical protein n=1 Tax=Streptomyces sp. NBC_01012 TaxID=2903717 RepID=UPI003865D619|nr:hypothetical protein OG623_31770 [Streptomyces sp. NBC_01012]
MPVALAQLHPIGPAFRQVTVKGPLFPACSGAHTSGPAPDAFHLPVGRPVTHKIYRDADHPSRLVLPFTTAAKPS